MQEIDQLGRHRQMGLAVVVIVPLQGEKERLGPGLVEDLEWLHVVTAANWTESKWSDREREEKQLKVGVDTTLFEE